MDQRGPAEVDDVEHLGGHRLAVDKTFILLHLPLPLVGVSIVMERERHQNDSLADG